MPSDSLEELFNRLIDLVLSQFSDIVVGFNFALVLRAQVERLRIFQIDETFIDVWLSSSGKYSYHWEQRHVRGLIHRHDTANPIKTFNENNRWRAGIALNPRTLTRKLFLLTYQSEYVSMDSCPQCRLLSAIHR